MRTVRPTHRLRVRGLADSAGVWLEDIESEISSALLAKWLGKDYLYVTCISSDWKERRTIEREDIKEGRTWKKRKTMGKRWTSPYLETKANMSNTVSQSVWLRWIFSFDNSEPCQFSSNDYRFVFYHTASTGLCPVMWQWIYISILRQ